MVLATSTVRAKHSLWVSERTQVSECVARASHRCRYVQAVPVIALCLPTSGQSGRGVFWQMFNSRSAILAGGQAVVCLESPQGRCGYAEVVGGVSKDLGLVRSKI